MKRNKDLESEFAGFDTFTGLPEDWSRSYKKGAMSSNGNIPEIPDKRGKLIPGLFQQTLPEFVKSYCNDRRKVIHMDADLYTSTLFVLTTIAAYLKNDDIIIFDEFFVPTHEFRAFMDFTKSYYIGYEVIAAVNNFMQIALKIKK